MMDAAELHEAHPFTEALTFNEVMAKKEFTERAVPDESCIMGVDKDGKQHRFCVGNEQGELLPKFLMAKLIAIESNKVFGQCMTITTSDDQRDRLYAMVREAQLRGIKPLAVQPEKVKKEKRAAAEPKQAQKAAKKQKAAETESKKQKAAETESDVEQGDAID